MSHSHDSSCPNHNRRKFLKTCFDTCCGLGATLMFAPVAARSAYAQQVYGDVIGQRPFGRVEKVADGVWALISTPFTKVGGAGDRTTLCNGGLIIGSERILAVDSYRMANGAQYVADACQFIAGRLPTHVVHTHFHFDHLGGTQGFLAAGATPEIIMTQGTREEAFSTYVNTIPEEDGSGLAISSIGKWGGNYVDATQIVADQTQPVTLDLGGRTVTITPLAGHTKSDLIVRDDKTGVIFGGDLIWDGIFPNFMSSRPTQWRRSVSRILQDPDSIIVPGHGGIVHASSDSMRTYASLLMQIEDHARTSFQKGASIQEAADQLVLSGGNEDLRYMREGFHEIAMDAWYKELG